MVRGARATVLLGLITSFIDKRTPKGTEWMGRIGGFRDFLVLAERDKLTALVEQDRNTSTTSCPTPGCLTYRTSVARKFRNDRNTASELVLWPHRHVLPVVFMNNLNHSMNAMQSTMVSNRRSSGSGGGGGGGFSGGGFSGGGGGAAAAGAGKSLFRRWQHAGRKRPTL